MIGRRPEEAEFVQRLIDRGRNRELVELHKQIIFLIDAVGAGIAAQREQVFVVQMKIASAGQNHSAGELVVQFGEDRADALKIEGVLGTGMRSGDDMGDAIGDGGLGHGERIFQGFCAVI